MTDGNSGPKLNTAILAAGAGGMYCGSCLRDNAIAAALIRAGHAVTLVPVFTPLRTEDGSVAIDEVFYGGVNVYLQHASPLFRHTPRTLDWLLNRPAVLKLAGKFGTQTSPAQLGPLTLSILRGENGAVVKELRRLTEFLRTDVRPQLVSLPNLMFIGLACVLNRELGVPVVCELTGEDLFLRQMAEPFRSEAHAVIRDCAAEDVSSFVATSSYYADEMAAYLNVDRGRIVVVHPSVPVDYVRHDERFERRQGDAPTIGYLARICPEKGFDRLVEAVTLLRRMPGMQNATLLAGGYLGPGDRAWFERVMGTAEPAAVRSVGEVDRPAKLELLDSVDVLSVPTRYAESKGIYVIEAMSRGVPVVQPRHGSFPELIDLTGGGVLTPPDDAHALATALADLLRDDARRTELGRAGRDAVRAGLTDDHAAAKMAAFYRDVLELFGSNARAQPTSP